MNKDRSNAKSGLLTGAIAGLAGTAVMMVMRSFDERYARMTLPKIRQDPGAFIMKQSERAMGLAGKLPRPLESAGAMLSHVGYGTTAGVLYATLRRRTRNRSALLDGGFFGMALYAGGYLGWLPVLGLTRPIWRQRFPEVAGELMRHIAYGITTAGVYEAIDGRQEVTQ